MYQEMILVTQELMVEGVFVGQPDPKGALVITPGVQVGPVWIVRARFDPDRDLSALETYATQEALLAARPELVAAFAPITYTDPESGQQVTTSVSIGEFFDQPLARRQKLQALADAEDALLAAQKKVLLKDAGYKAAVVAVALARKAAGAV